MTPHDTPKEDFVYQFAASQEFGGGGKAICFAAQVSGLYRSTDGGVTWHSAFTSLKLQETMPALAVAIPPNAEEAPGVFVGVNGGILRSWDNGRNWESTLLPSPPPVVSALTISPNFAQDGILFAGTLEDGVLCSSDRGRRWAAWNFGLLDLNILCLAISPAFATDETLYAGTQSGLFRSTNGGRAWREVHLPGGFEAVLSLAISPDFAKDATLFAGTENHGLRRSRDGGQTWERVGKSVFAEPVNAILLDPEYPRKPNSLVLQGSVLFASQDGGETWKLWREAKLAGKDITAVYAPTGFGPRARVLVGFADGIVQRI